MALIRPPGFAWPGNGALEAYARPPSRTAACPSRRVSAAGAVVFSALVTMKSLRDCLRVRPLKGRGCGTATSKLEMGNHWSMPSTDGRSHRSSVLGVISMAIRRLIDFATAF